MNTTILKISNHWLEKLVGAKQKNKNLPVGQ